MEAAAAVQRQRVLLRDKEAMARLSRLHYLAAAAAAAARRKDKVATVLLCRVPVTQTRRWAAAAECIRNQQPAEGTRLRLNTRAAGTCRGPLGAPALSHGNFFFTRK